MIKNTKEENILIMLRQQAKVREIKNALNCGAEIIKRIRTENEGKFPEIKIKSKTGTRTKKKEQEQEQPKIYEEFPNLKTIHEEWNDNPIITQSRMGETTLYFTDREKFLTKRMFRAVIRQRAVKITEEDEYQKLVDKITGD